MSVPSFIRRGALAGAFAGAAMALLLLVLGEPVIARSSALLESAEHAHETLVSPGVQSIGGLVGAILLGVGFGTAFAVVFAATRHRLPGADDRLRALALAGVAFVTIYVVPVLKYPADPPGSADPGTASHRARWYLAAVLWSVLSVVAAWRLARAAVERGLADHFGGGLAVAAWVLLVAIGVGALPAAQPIDVPGRLLWEYRLVTAAGGFALWSLVGITFGWLIDRSEGHRSLDLPPAPRRAL